MSEIFKRKTEKELKALTVQRLKAYYRAEQRRFNVRFQPCECCGELYLTEDEEKTRKMWHKYIMFVKAILKEKENR